MKNIKYLFILILLFVMVPAANALTADELFEKESAECIEYLDTLNEIAKEKGWPEVTLENAGPLYTYDGEYDVDTFVDDISLTHFRFYVVKNGFFGFGLNPSTGKWQGSIAATTQGGFGSAVDTEGAGYGFSYPDKDGKRVYVDLSLYGMCKTAAELTNNTAVAVKYFNFEYQGHIYILTDDGTEFLVQYAERPDFTGRENFKLYPFDEIFNEAKAKRENKTSGGDIVETGPGISDNTQTSEEVPDEPETEEPEQPDAETTEQTEQTDTEEEQSEQPDTEQEPVYQEAEDDTDKKDNSLIIWIVLISAVVVIVLVIVLTLIKKRK